MYFFHDAKGRDWKAFREERGLSGAANLVVIQYGDSGPVLEFTVAQLENLVEFGYGVNKPVEARPHTNSPEGIAERNRRNGISPRDELG